MTSDTLVLMQYPGGRGDMLAYNRVRINLLDFRYENHIFWDYKDGGEVFFSIFLKNRSLYCTRYICSEKHNPYTYVV